MTIRLTDERVRWLVEQPDVATTRTTIESLAREVQERRAVEAKLRDILEQLYGWDMLFDFGPVAGVQKADDAPWAKSLIAEAIRLLDGEP